ncbi:MAG: hypothetical protein M3220_10690 [Chloroflexota bacterium]|nr:hypothetical protein [Chloroflexota bacterium]
MRRAQTALQRCLNSPYLWRDESKRGQVEDELAGARELLKRARTSFNEEDEATGLKQSWGAMFRAAHGLVYNAGYMAEQLRCLEVVLQAHYPDITEEDIAGLRRAQELVGPPDVAIERARTFIDKAASLVQGELRDIA